MISSTFLNFAEEKSLKIGREEEDGKIQFTFDDGPAEVKLLLSKKQVEKILLLLAAR